MAAPDPVHRWLSDKTRYDFCADDLAYAHKVDDAILKARIALQSIIDIYVEELNPTTLELAQDAVDAIKAL